MSAGCALALASGDEEGDMEISIADVMTPGLSKDQA
jgi:hypothetical protein